MLQETPIPTSEQVDDLLVREAPGEAERAARHALRRQIARLERQLADAFLTAYELGVAAPRGGSSQQPRVLGLAELERVRDELVARLRESRAAIAQAADRQEGKRLLLEEMLLEPGRHRFTRVTCRELGEPGCGAWEVRPRLGLIGMLMGWWQVKLSSGCPLARGRDCVPARVSRPGRCVPAHLSRYSRDAGRFPATAE